MKSNQDWSPEWRDALKKKIPPAKWEAMTPIEREAALRSENDSVKAGWGCVGIIVVLFVLGSLFGSGDNGDRVQTRAVNDATRSERVLRDAGVDADAYAREARELGLTPDEAVAAGVILCSEIGDCPSGMTQAEAREIRRQLER